MNTRNPSLAQVIRSVRGREITVSIRPRSRSNPELLLDYYLNGERKRRGTKTTDVQAAVRMAEAWNLDAELALDQKVADADENPRPPEGENPRVRDLADWYTGTWMIARNNKPRAIESAEGTLREFELWCREDRIGRVNQLNVVGMLRYSKWLTEDRKNSAKTIQNKLTCVRACLNAAVTAKIIPASPVDQWILPTAPDAEIDPLEPGELAQVIACVEEHAPVIANLVKWIAYTGCRPSDARLLTWRQVDMKRQTAIRIQEKTRRPVEFQLGQEALSVLAAEKLRGKPGPNGEIFTDFKGNVFVRNRPLKWFKRAMNRGGFKRADDVNLKTLRHTFGYIMANYAGCPLPTLQRLMGHATIDMTMKYVRNADAQPHLKSFVGIIQREAKKANREVPKEVVTFTPDNDQFQGKRESKPRKSGRKPSQNH